MKINRLLIANRGEIAVRVMRACREMGISTVAVFSEADRDAPHVGLADAAVEIGPGPAGESYLRIDRIVEAARHSGADAVHPGYGFLSENAAFAQAVVDAGLTFVGPPAAVIELLGDKSAAKSLMEQAGVPVVPGYHGDDQSATRLRKEAKSIGTPLLIKAAAGGGGRGMRVVRDLSTFEALADEARREAAGAFGSGALLLERYVERPRHIEVQIFGDTHGNAIHLFERECSIQRRHQKIVEESPSTALTPELRAQIVDAALKAAKAAGYVGAGTVEFLLEGTRFYFLEVNTRLQVEHPVTEMITGLDLVKLQLRVAMGEALPAFDPSAPIMGDSELAGGAADVMPIQGYGHGTRKEPRGHAIEVRIYAEDPSTGFLPSTGVLTQWIAPSGPGIRLDSGVERGSTVSPFYDPMLAKLIAHGETRMEAIDRLEQALMGFSVMGVKTNIPYLLDIVRHPAFRAGDLSTGFLAEHFAGWKPKAEIPVEVLLALAAEAVTAPKSTAGPRGEAKVVSPWGDDRSWRNVK